MTAAALWAPAVARAGTVLDAELEQGREVRVEMQPSRFDRRELRDE